MCSVAKSRQLLDGLCFILASGLQHNSLDLDNVLFTDEGLVKIGRFWKENFSACVKIIQVAFIAQDRETMIAVLRHGVGF